MYSYRKIERADGSFQVQQIRPDGSVRNYDSDYHGYIEWMAEGNTAPVVAYVAPPTPTLEETKAAKINAIDTHTRILVTAGFAFAGKSFSMSEAAQRNWAALAAAQANGLLSFPLTISTVDEQAHTLESGTELLQFMGAYLTYQTDPAQPLGAGRVLKAQVNSCTTVDEVEAILDNR